MSSVDLKAHLGLAEESDVAALRDNMNIASLRNERARGLGPPYIRIGRKVFYPIDKLRAYLAAATVTPTKRRTLVDGGKVQRMERRAT